MTIRKIADFIRTTSMDVIRGQRMQSFQEIDARREAAGLTRKALYEQAGLHKETWRRTASGRTEPNVRTLTRLADALDQLEAAQ